MLRPVSSSILEEAKSQWIAKNDLSLLQDPKMYVQTVLDVHKKYNALVMSAFNNDAGFVAALDKVSICSGTH